MASFNANDTAIGKANTSTTPSYSVTSNASATAFSNVSQKNAKQKAKKLAQKLADSVAQNDANIISQTLKLSPAGVIGQLNYLNLSFAFKVPINGNGEFNGLIKEFVEDEISTYSKAVNMTSSKIVYEPVTFTPIPNTVQLTTLSATVYNYGGVYGDKIVNGQLFSSPTAKAIIENNRLSTISIPATINNVKYIYKIKIVSDIRMYLSEPLTYATHFSDLNSKIYGIKLNSKTLSSVHVINVSDNTITTFTGTSLSETFTNDKVWNIITLNFSRAFPSLVEKNIYPLEITL